MNLLEHNLAQATATRVAVVEDDTRVRESLAVLINGASGFTCAASYANGDTAVKGIPTLRPNVVLMDINLPDMSGIQCVHQLKAACPDIQVIMLTVNEDIDVIFRALQAGASGYLLKRTPPSEILNAIADVHRGGAPMTSSIARKVIQSFHQTPPKTADATNLTPRESTILDMLAQGYLYKEIAGRLTVKFETVHTHVRSIYQKLHVRSRSEAVAKYYQNALPPRS